MGKMVCRLQPLLDIKIGWHAEQAQRPQAGDKGAAQNHADGDARNEFETAEKARP